MSQGISAGTRLTAAVPLTGVTLLVTRAAVARLVGAPSLIGQITG